MVITQPISCQIGWNCHSMSGLWSHYMSHITYHTSHIKHHMSQMSQITRKQPWNPCVIPFWLFSVYLWHLWWLLYVMCDVWHVTGPHTCHSYHTWHTVKISAKLVSNWPSNCYFCLCCIFFRHPLYILPCRFVEPPWSVIQNSLFFFCFFFCNQREVVWINNSP